MRHPYGVKEFELRFRQMESFNSPVEEWERFAEELLAFAEELETDGFEEARDAARRADEAEAAQEAAENELEDEQDRTRQAEKRVEELEGVLKYVADKLDSAKSALIYVGGEDRDELERMIDEAVGDILMATEQVGEVM